MLGIQKIMGIDEIIFIREKNKMTLEEKQEIFDNVKWEAGVEKGEDLCGTYDFCTLCEREKSFPCARAQKRFNGEGVRVAVIRKKRFIGGF